MKDPREIQRIFESIPDSELKEAIVQILDVKKFGKYPPLVLAYADKITGLAKGHSYMDRDNAKYLLLCQVALRWTKCANDPKPQLTKPKDEEIERLWEQR